MHKQYLADSYPSTTPNSEVHGYDLAAIQPHKYLTQCSHLPNPQADSLGSGPKNLTFSQCDIESPWYGTEEDSWDLIHMRMLNGSIRHWDLMYAQILR